VTYKDEAEKVHEQDFSVKSSIFQEHCNETDIVNPIIPVKYVKSDPTVAVLEGNQSDTSLLIMGGIGLLVVGLLGAWALYTFEPF
jgi:hypothetical protein